MEGRDKTANDFFSCTVRDRVMFEAGIKMGTIYHQFVGTPFDGQSVSHLEETISRAIEVQPYVVSAKVTIDRSVIPPRDDTYSYVSLTGDMIRAEVCIEIDSVKVTAKMGYINEIGYPLMYISDVSDENEVSIR